MSTVFKLSIKRTCRYCNVSFIPATQEPASRCPCWSVLSCVLRGALSGPCTYDGDWELEALISTFRPAVRLLMHTPDATKGDKYISLVLGKLG